MSGDEQRDRVYRAALGATVGMVPGIAALSTVVVYIVLDNTEEVLDNIGGYVAVLTGSLFALIVWLGVAFFYRNSTTANGLSPRNYSALRQRHGQLESQLEYLKSKHSDDVAYEQASCECEEIRGGLESKGVPWVNGTGYIELWQRVHRAEEALVTIETRETVTRGAMRDERRLMNSKMANKESLLERLRYAVAMLDGSGDDEHLRYLARPPQKPPKDSKDPAKAKASRDLAKAKSILSEVRYEINSFRDSVWEGIVHARNRLVVTSVLTAFAAYVLLGLVIVMNDASAGESAFPGEIFAAVIYFLVGAIVGLFSRSQIEAKADTAVDDYGLSKARRVHAFLISGLAAVGGVLIVSVLDAQVLTQGDGSGAPNVISLSEIFVINPGLLIVAAVFGLTPDLLIQRLRQQAERYKADLKSTEPGQSVDDLGPGGSSPGAASS